MAPEQPLSTENLKHNPVLTKIPNKLTHSTRSPNLDNRTVRMRLSGLTYTTGRLRSMHRIRRSLAQTRRPWRAATTKIESHQTKVKKTAGNTNHPTRKQTEQRPLKLPDPPEHTQTPKSPKAAQRASEQHYRNRCD